MSSSPFRFTKPFSKEKPRSSVTEWVEILTSSGIQEEAYDGIPELMDAINLQASGPSEASRAIRKKLKHGSPHQQYRALVLIKAVVENIGAQKSAFADTQLLDAMKNVGQALNVDQRVRKKLVAMLSSWNQQFKGDPTMAAFITMHERVSPDPKLRLSTDVANMLGIDPKRDEEMRRKKEEKHLQREIARLEASGVKVERRYIFDFEKGKPKIIASIAEASQAANNLLNAITLVNPRIDSVGTNERVQECLKQVQQSKKVIVRCIQLVENEEIIGTLLDTNERLDNALENYEKAMIPDVDYQPDPQDSTEDVSRQFGSTTLNDSTEDVFQTNEDVFQTNAAEPKGKEPSKYTGYLDDLEDLNFGGSIGKESPSLPPPIRPSTANAEKRSSLDDEDHRGALSDFSDYESSDEEAHKARASGSTPKKQRYVYVSDSDGEPSATALTTAVAEGKKKSNNPFADPFADKM